jgi:isopenicillin-N N-acyltransferase-like protein
MGVPVPLIRRRVLTSDGLGRAVGHVIRAQRAHSLNYLIADADGGAIDLETTPDEVFTLDAEDGLLTHANHFQSLAARAKLKDTLIARWPDSLLRERRIAKHLECRRGNIGIDDLQCALRDHYGLPEAICRHETEQSDDPNPIITVASVIMDLEARRMWVAPGPPCQNDYREYAF